MRLAVTRDCGRICRRSRTRLTMRSGFGWEAIHRAGDCEVGLQVGAPIGTQRRPLHGSCFSPERGEQVQGVRVRQVSERIASVLSFDLG